MEYIIYDLNTVDIYSYSLHYLYLFYSLNEAFDLESSGTIVFRVVKLINSRSSIVLQSQI